MRVLQCPRRILILFNRLPPANIVLVQCLRSPKHVSKVMVFEDDSVPNGSSKRMHGRKSEILINFTSASLELETRGRLNRLHLSLIDRVGPLATSGDDDAPAYRVALQHFLLVHFLCVLLAPCFGNNCDNVASDHSSQMVRRFDLSNIPKPTV